MSKYNSRITEVDGITFHSKKEAHAYSELKIREKHGEIGEIELQPKFSIDINGVHVCNYIADFRFVDYRDNSTVVMDVKGMKTQVYRLKKKLMKACHNIEIFET